MTCFTISQFIEMHLYCSLVKQFGSHEILTDFWPLLYLRAVKRKKKKKGHLISGNYHIWRQMAASQACDSTAKLLRHGWKAAESWWHLCTCIKSCNMLTRSFVHAWAKNGARLHGCKARLWNLPIKWLVWCYKTTNVHFKFNFWYMT